jgi:hypothetical protein
MAGRNHPVIITPKQSSCDNALERQGLWVNLTEIRTASAKLEENHTPQSNHLRHISPGTTELFHSFGHFASNHLYEHTNVQRRVEGTPSLDIILQHSSHRLLEGQLLRETDLHLILMALAKSSMTAGQIANLLAPNQGQRVNRSLLWMAKFGLIEFCE